MGIAIVGPEKYDFQDLACIELMLRFLDRAGARFRVEPENREDAELILVATGLDRVIEVQVKGERGALTLPKLASYLAHFPDRAENGTLFDRLIHDPQRIAVIVASARCDDATSGYVVPIHWDGSTRPPTELRRMDVTDFLQQYRTSLDQQGEVSELTARRQQYLRSAARGLAADALRSVLARIVVLENVCDAVLEDRCTAHLRNLRIPHDQTRAVIHRLRDIVKDGKRAQADIYPRVRSALRSDGPATLRPYEYVLRGDEDALSLALRTSGVLLLSGSPRIGKSHTARNVAAEFEPLGYQVKSCFDVEEAERFLTDPGASPRLALLDDPFGGAHPVPAAAALHVRLSRLISALGSDRKLIVAQARDRLLAATRKLTLSEVLTAGVPWRDLDALPAEFLPRLWEWLCTRYQVQEPVASTVLNALREQSLALEPGCLGDLAACLRGMATPPLALEALSRLARRESADLAHALRDESDVAPLSGLAVATIHGHSLTQAELAFVLGEGGGHLPAVAAIKGRSYGWPSEEEAESRLPAYEIEPKLTAGAAKVLETFELRRIIEWTSSNRIAFAHPYYRAVGEHLIDDATQASRARLVTMIERGLFCLCPKTSRATAKNLDWIYDRTKTAAGKQAVAQQAARGLDALYPSTRDICFRFLMRHFDALPEEMRQELPSWIDDVRGLSLDHAIWRHGEPTLPMPDEMGFARVEVSLATLLDLDLDERDVPTMGEGSPPATPEQAWTAARSYARAPDRLDSFAFARLLSYDEGLIRAEAICAWLAIARDDDAEALDRIFDEVHPAIVTAALKGAARGWNSYHADRRERVLAGLHAMAQAPAGAAVLVHELVLFGRGNDGDEACWPIFAALLPCVLASLPAGFRFNKARLYDVALRATAHVPGAAMLSICEQWIGMVERIAAKRVPSDYELGVTHILVAGTPVDDGRRRVCLERLMQVPGTGVAIRIVADLVSDWHLLTEGERARLVTAVTAKRPDAIWLQATALTRKSVPTELTEQVFGCDFAQAIKRPDLRLVGAKIHLGQPDLLAYIGVAHCGGDAWAAVVKEIAQAPDGELFEAAWGDVLSLWDPQEAAQLVAQVATQHPNRMFEVVLMTQMRRNLSFNPKVWAAVFASASDAEMRADWIERIAGRASNLFEGFLDVDGMLPKDVSRDLLAHLNPDSSLLEVVLRFKDLGDRLDVRNELAQVVAGFFKNHPPLMHKTCTRLAHELSAMGITDPILHEQIKRRGDKLAEKFIFGRPSEPEVALAPWVHNGDAAAWT